MWSSGVECQPVIGVCRGLGLSGSGCSSVLGPTMPESRLLPGLLLFLEVLENPF